VWLLLHQRLAAAITDKAAGKLAPRSLGNSKWELDEERFVQ
jgi:hypothetical protein